MLGGSSTSRPAPHRRATIRSPTSSNNSTTNSHSFQSDGHFPYALFFRLLYYILVCFRTSSWVPFPHGRDSLLVRTAPSGYLPVQPHGYPNILTVRGIAEEALFNDALVPSSGTLTIGLHPADGMEGRGIPWSLRRVVFKAPSGTVTCELRTAELVSSWYCGCRS